MANGNFFSPAGMQQLAAFVMATATGPMESIAVTGIFILKKS